MRTFTGFFLAILTAACFCAPGARPAESMSKRDKMARYDFLAEIYLKMGNKTKAIEGYEKALRLIPTETEIRRKLAKLYLETNSDEKAVDEYKTLLEINPGNNAYRLELAQAYQKSGDYDGMIEQCRRVLEGPGQDHEDRQARTLLIAAYREKGELDDLIAELQSSLKNDPEKTEPYFFLGEAYQAAGQTEKMTEIYSKGLELFPENIVFISKVVSELSQQKKFSAALPLLKKMVETRPRDSNYAYQLGLCYLNTDQTDKAVELWDTFGEEIQGPDPYFYYHSGCAYRNFKLYERSIRQLKKALPDHRDRHRILSAMAQTYEEMGDDEKAAQTCLKILDSPDSEYWLKRAQGMLIRIYQNKDELDKLASLIEAKLADEQTGGNDED